LCFQRGNALRLYQRITGHTKLATQVKQVVLNRLKRRMDINFQRLCQQHADDGVQFVHFAQGVHAQAVLGDARSIAQTGGAIVACAGIYLTQSIAQLKFLYNSLIIDDAIQPYMSSQPSGQHPIGVFDSGVGGLSVLKHIHTLLPHESLIYVADSANAPYGNKTPEEITERCLALTDFLLAHGAKAIVVACNTATAAAIDRLRQEHPALPIVGMEPAVKPAAAASKNGIIGVLATVGTLKSAQFAALLENYGRNVKVVTQACIGLVECIERGELDGSETLALLQKYLKPLLDEGADTIVLGCTHYPFVKPLIQELVGEGVTLVDTGAAVAKRLQSLLAECDLLNIGEEKGNVEFWTNSAYENAMDVIKKLWGNHVE